MTIKCKYHSECDILKKYPHNSTTYKSMVKTRCDTDNYVNCPAYINLDNQKKKDAKNEHTPENIRRLEEHLQEVLEGMNRNGD